MLWLYLNRYSPNRLEFKGETHGTKSFQICGSQITLFLSLPLTVHESHSTFIVNRHCPLFSLLCILALRLIALIGRCIVLFLWFSGLSFEKNRSKFPININGTRLSSYWLKLIRYGLFQCQRSVISCHSSSVLHFTENVMVSILSVHGHFCCTLKSNCVHSLFSPEAIDKLHRLHIPILNLSLRNWLLFMAPDHIKNSILWFVYHRILPRSSFVIQHIESSPRFVWISTEFDSRYLLQNMIPWEVNKWASKQLLRSSSKWVDSFLVDDVTCFEIFSVWASQWVDSFQVDDDVTCFEIFSVWASKQV